MPRKGTHATLFAFDGISGKDMYATGDQLQAAGNLAGITVANGRVYVLTVDNTLHVFGKYLER
jgi:ABC-type glucose/galactose transport system permease subunit